MNGSALVTNIQRFSLHDGPGIRTTVFLKGCTLRCPWCANPENISFGREPYDNDGAAAWYGTELPLDDIYAEVMKDRAYYAEGGGVTFSGGEPLAHAKKIEPLLEKLRDEKISVCMETALFVPPEQLETSLRYADCYCADIKILDEEKCASILGGNLSLYVGNARRLQMAGKNVTWRLPLISPHTTDEENLSSAASFCAKNGIRSIELIKGHNLAAKKYASLARPMYEAPDLTASELEKIRLGFESYGISAVVCKV